MAADALVLTAYYKVVDDVSDEHAAKRAASFAIQGLLHRASAKARGHLPDIQAVLHEQTLRQAELEAQHCADPDFAADPTAQMTAALFRLAAAQPEQADVLARMGMLLGKIYIIWMPLRTLSTTKKPVDTMCFMRWGFPAKQWWSR